MVKAGGGDNLDVLGWRYHQASKWGAGDRFVPGMQTRESAAPRWPLTSRSGRLWAQVAAVQKAAQRVADCGGTAWGPEEEPAENTGGPGAGPPEAESLEAGKDERCGL